jgi:hypothetical protein
VSGQAEGTRRSAAEPGLVEGGSGCLGVDDDGLAVADDDRLAGGGLEGRGEGAGAAFGVDAGVVVVRAEVVEAGVGVGQ